MTHSSIADRFTGESGKRLLVDLLRRQTLIEGNGGVAETFAAQCSLMSLPANSVFIRQGECDNDVYFILSGLVRILVNEREVAVRLAGQHIGEMALVDPAARRTATVVTIEPTVLAKITEHAFSKIANAHPFLWRNISIELVRRLDERRKFHHSPNPLPSLFIGSSKEGLAVASAFAAAIPADVASAALWSEGIFGASHFPIEDLVALLQNADFAALFATADDTVITRGKEFSAPRDNVVFELGLFMGAITRHRTFLIVPSGADVKIPTDLMGINTVRYDSKGSSPDEAVKSAAKEVVDMIKKLGTR